MSSYDLDVAKWGSQRPTGHRWRELSYSHQREYAESIEEAKKKETRARRIEVAVRAIRAKPERKR